MPETISMTKSALAAALTLLALSGPSIAWAGSACTDASAREAPGRWANQRLPDVDVEQSSIIPKSEWSAVKKRTEVYAELLRQALGEFRGYDAIGHRSVAGALFKDGPAKYRYQVYMYDFACVNGVLHGPLDKHAEPMDYGDTVTAIEVNGVWDMAGPGANYVIGGKHYYQLGTPMGTIRGYPAFQHENKWVVLVSRPGSEFPFAYASRKQLLDERREQNEHDRADELAYARDEAVRKKINHNHDSIRAHLDAVEARYTPEQLKEPAMTTLAGTNPNSLWDDKFDFQPTKQEVNARGQELLDDFYGKPFAIPHGAYFDRRLPKSTPQFFAVSFQWNKTDKDSVRRRDEFFTRFDFARLASLIGE